MLACCVCQATLPEGNCGLVVVERAARKGVRVRAQGADNLGKRSRPSHGGKTRAESLLGPADEMALPFAAAPKRALHVRRFSSIRVREVDDADANGRCLMEDFARGLRPRHADEQSYRTECRRLLAPHEGDR